MVFQWGESSTSRSNIVRTADLRIDVHKDFSNPGYAVAKLQVNKEAKDPAAKEFLKKGNKGAHKTTHKNLAEIRYSQVNFDEGEFARQIAEAWMYPTAEPSQGETVESSGSGYGPSGSGSYDGHAAGEQAAAGQPAWQWDSDQKTNRYWDGGKWVYWNVQEGREQHWDGTTWQWNN